jgi:2-polyprenyl-3-methyl-5-hydroxy-6-metoxy-1,4-benzoquinol methylase
MARSAPVEDIGKTNMDMEKLHALLGSVVNDLGAAANAALVITGHKLSLFRTLAEAGPLTSAELAERTGTCERNVREWLCAQAASGLVNYEPATGRFSMSPEQAAVFADPQSPVFMAAGFEGLRATYIDEPKLTAAFKSGKGFGWGERCNCLFCGTEQFFRPTYRAHLLHEWLPALDGAVDRLRSGGKVADIGCGHGASTLIMAEAFPEAQFIGFDFHRPSIEHARALAEEQGLTNVRFEVATAQAYAGRDYDLATIFDALHDMGDPVGAAANIRRNLKPEGALMVVEPMAGDRLEDNLHPVGRLYYAFSAATCVPASLAQDVGLALGAQAGETRLRGVLQQGGFSRVRRATETPFSMILEARP